MSYANPELHTFIGGITGGGKTTFGSKMFSESSRLALFINTQDEVTPERYADIVFHDIEGFCYAINEFKTRQKLCLSPTTERDISKADLNQIIEILFQIGHVINENNRIPEIWCEIYIDEIYEFQTKMGKPTTSVLKIWKRGRRYGIVGIAMSQRPADVSHTILTQSRIHYLFYLGAYETGYFKAYGIPVFEPEYLEWMRQEYHFIKYEDEQIEKCEPIQI